MLRNLVVLAILAGAAWWYWQGPYQDSVNPSYESLLEKNAEDMAGCMRAEAFKYGATGVGSGQEKARKDCAKKFNLYFDDGNWHSYDRTRPSDK